MTQTPPLAQPIVDAMHALGQRVWVDAGESSTSSTWLDIGQLCVQVRIGHGYGLYLDHVEASFRGPDEVYRFDQLDDLLERLRALVPQPVLRKPE